MGRFAPFHRASPRAQPQPSAPLPARALSPAEHGAPIYFLQLREALLHVRRARTDPTHMRRVRVVICVRIQRGKHRWIQREATESEEEEEREEGGRGADTLLGKVQRPRRKRAKRPQWRAAATRHFKKNAALFIAATSIT